MDRALCRKCCGNGVVKIPGGVSMCPRCDGRCYESDAQCDKCWDTGYVHDADGMEDNCSCGALARAAMTDTCATCRRVAVVCCSDIRVSYCADCCEHPFDDADGEGCDE